MAGIRVGIDVGGTFTDIVFLSEDGTVLTRKILSSPDDYSRTIRVGLAEIIREAGVEPGQRRPSWRAGHWPALRTTDR